MLLAAMLPALAQADGDVTISLALEASLPDFASIGLSIAGGEGRAKLKLSADDWGASLVLPWLAAGSLEPAGLAAFIQRPQGLSYRLGRYAARPFIAPAPLDAPLLGLAAGKEGGCFIMDPRREGLASWSGAWLSPRGLPLSALTAWAVLPEDSGDGSWSDPPAPAMERSWHAIGVSFNNRAWRTAVGAGAMHSSPGADAWALRIENLLSLRPFKLESVAALCAGSWRGPSGSLAPVFFVDARLSASVKNLALSLDYDESRADWAALPKRSLALGLKAKPNSASLQASAAADFSSLKAIQGLELRFKATPTILPWLSAYGSYRLKGPEPERFEPAQFEPERLELGCSLRAGQRHAVELDAMWRADTEGRYLKFGGSYAFALPRGRLLVYLRTNGWRRYEPPLSGAATDALPDAGLRYSQSFP
jgi:hypothetical protein